MAKKRRKKKKKNSSPTPISISPPIDQEDSKIALQQKHLHQEHQEPNQKNQSLIEDNQPTLDSAITSDPASDTVQHPLLVNASLAFHQGNYQSVHQILNQLESSDEYQNLSDEDLQHFTLLKNRLSLDPVSLWFPLALFCLWAFLFYRSLP